MIMNDLTLIIPAKHEAESLPTVLDELNKFKFDININIILHHSDVKTIQALENHNVNIIYQTNFGYGNALIEGIALCKTKYFCIFNADGSFDPKELTNMYNLAVLKKADFIFGSRYMKNSGSKDDTIITYVGNKIFTFLGNFFFSLNISDILYTYVLADTKKAKLLNLNKKDFSFCVELPIEAKRGKNIIISSPSYERPRIAGQKKVNAFKDGLYILISLIKLYFS
jgi:glycosyltransferase involved in cell wall biosynthesis